MHIRLPTPFHVAVLSQLCVTLTRVTHANSGLRPRGMARNGARSGRRAVELRRCTEEVDPTTDDSAAAVPGLVQRSVRGVRQAAVHSGTAHAHAHVRRMQHRLPRGLRWPGGGATWPLGVPPLVLLHLAGWLDPAAARGAPGPLRGGTGMPPSQSTPAAAPWGVAARAAAVARSPTPEAGLGSPVLATGGSSNVPRHSTLSRSPSVAANAGWPRHASGPHGRFPRRVTQQQQHHYQQQQKQEQEQEQQKEPARRSQHERPPPARHQPGAARPAPQPARLPRPARHLRSQGGRVRSQGRGSSHHGNSPWGGGGNAWGSSCQRSSSGIDWATAAAATGKVAADSRAAVTAAIAAAANASARGDGAPRAVRCRRARRGYPRTRRVGRSWRGWRRCAADGSGSPPLALGVAASWHPDCFTCCQMPRRPPHGRLRPEGGVP